MSGIHDRITADIPELKRCFQCGTCVSSCPAKIYSGHFSPREFILDCLRGLEDNVMNDNLWRCLTCNSCNERCPQGVNPYEVIVKLKNIALENSLVSPEKKESLMSAFDRLMKTGNSYPITELTEKKRKDACLKPLKKTSL